VTTDHLTEPRGEARTRRRAAWTAGLGNLGVSLFFLLGTDGSHGDLWIEVATATAVLTVAVGLVLGSRPRWRAIGAGLVIGTVVIVVLVVAVFTGAMALYGMSDLE
jgi:hypothetical protein